MKNIINAAIQIVPKSKIIDQYELIDRAIEVIKASGVKYSVGPMETALEGDYNTVMRVMKEAQLICMEAGADELVVNIKLHIRKGADISFDEKIDKHI